jgi:hypothetical protein
MSDSMTLDDRISFAFTDEAKSADFENLIRDVEFAAASATAEAEAARHRALDPSCLTPDVADARREMEDAIFRNERLQTAVKRLGERLKMVKAAEENTRRQISYDQARATRDALAQELAQVYPPIATQLADLMCRIEANDREVATINTRLPKGAGRLLVTELIARGMDGFVHGGIVTPSLLENLRLPIFHHDPFNPYSWPSYTPMLRAMGSGT